MITVTPFLTFEGSAALAIELYTSAFADGAVLSDERFTEGPMAGRVKLARIRIGGQEIVLSDSPPVHDFTFTPSSSLLVECDDEEQLRTLHETLAPGGKDLMPIDEYAFAKLFCWVQDRLGVSWQLLVPLDEEEEALG